MSRNRRPGGRKKIRAADPKVEGLAKKMLGHFIPYEAGMMRALNAKLLLGSPTRLDRNADIESFHIHARNLIEFFTDDKQCAIDPRAFTTKDYRIDGNFIPKRLETKISQQIVHLAHERTDANPDKLSDQERNRTVAAIEKQIKRFEKALRPEWRPIWEEGVRQMDFESEIGTKERCFRYSVGGPTDPAGPSAPPTIDFPANQVLGATGHVTFGSSDASTQLLSKKDPTGPAGSSGAALKRNASDAD